MWEVKRGGVVIVDSGCWCLGHVRLGPAGFLVGVCLGKKCWTSEKGVGFFLGREGGGVEGVLVHNKV